MPDSDLLKDDTRAECVERVHAPDRDPSTMKEFMNNVLSLYPTQIQHSTVIGADGC